MVDVSPSVNDVWTGNPPSDAHEPDPLQITAQLLQIIGGVNAVEGRAGALEGRATALESGVSTVQGAQATDQARIAALEALGGTGMTPVPGGPAACVATSNLTLSGLQTIDGYTTLAGDRVLVTGQTTIAQNGLYVAGAGAWSRATDMDSAGEFKGRSVYVEAGTLGAGTTWYCATTVTTVGTDAVGFTKVSSQGPLQTAVSANSLSVATLTAQVGPFAGATLAPETGYLRAWTDSGRNFIGGITLAGEFEIMLSEQSSVPLLALAGAAVLAPETGFFWAKQDAARNVLFGVWQDGTFWANPSEDFAARLGQTAAFGAAVAGIAGSLAPVRDIAMWGDSMTTRTGAAVVSPAFAATSTATAVAGLLSSRAVYNGGIGGQTATQIAARQGGLPILVSLSGDQIPASGAVSVTSQSINILYNSGVYTGVASGTLLGVAGTMTTDASGNWTFTRAGSGAIVACPPGSQFIPDVSLAYRNRPAVIWAGRNDPRTNRAQIVATRDAILAMADRLTDAHQPFVVMSICNGTGEASGSSAYPNIIEINRELAEYFGARFFDLRGYMVARAIYDAGITPSSDDLADMAADTIPRALIETGASPHFNAAGCTMAAQFITRALRAAQITYQEV